MVGINNDKILRRKNIPIMSSSRNGQGWLRANSLYREAGNRARVNESDICKDEWGECIGLKCYVIVELALPQVLQSHRKVVNGVLHNVEK